LNGAPIPTCPSSKAINPEAFFSLVALSTIEIFMFRYLFLSAVLFLPGFAQSSLGPREGWAILPSNPSLTASPSWGCVPGIRASEAAIKLASTTGFIGQINSNGPRLLVSGDFSIIARFSNSTQFGGWVELESQPATSPTVFWRGLKKVDFGVIGGRASLIVWTGDQDSPTINQGFNLGATPNTNVDLELARVGNQLVLFSGMRELGRVTDPGVFSSGSLHFGLLTAGGNEISLSQLAVSQPAGLDGNAIFSPRPTHKAPRSGIGLRDLAASRNFLMGTTFSGSALNNESSYNAIGREFNAVTPGNDLKWESTEPERGRFTFCAADRLLEYADAAGQKMRGHVLVWHEQLPGYMKNGTWTRETLLAAMRSHILAVAGRYKGRLYAWDVANEAIDDAAPHGLRSTIFSRVIGPDYLDFAFRYAKEADPAAKLFYNDYGGEGMGPKSQAVFNLVTAMKARGVPIDGVGLQLHYGLAGSPSAADVEQNIRRLAQAGFEVQITEFDITAPLPDSPAKQAEQATIYRGFYRACRAVPQCTAFIIWGVADSDSWILTFRPGNFGGLLFDNNGWNKLAYYALQQEMGGTRAPAPSIAGGGVVNAASYLSTPAFSEGSFFSIFGANLAAKVEVWDNEFQEGRAPTTLGGVRVLVDNKPAFLSLVTPGQINAIAPAGTIAGSSKVVVELNGQPSELATANSAATSPAFFLFSPRNNRYAVAITADGASLIAPSDLFGGPVSGRSVRPAKPGESVILYGSGFGQTMPESVIGRIPTSAATLSTPFALRIGTVTVTLDYAGRSGFVGVYQFNIRIPDLPDGEYELVGELDGVRTSSGRFIAIQK